jgi:hypothetical protein
MKSIRARQRYSVVAPTPSELCLADGAAGRSDARAVELPISVRALPPSWTVDSTQASIARAFFMATSKSTNRALG